MISFRILLVAVPTFGLLLNFNPGLVLLQDSGYSASYCFILSAAASGGRGSYKELGEVWAEAAVQSEALLGTPVLEVCVSFCHEMFPFMLFILTLYPFMKYVFASCVFVA